MNNSEYYIGLMTGTSMDGIDAVLVNFSEERPELLNTLCHPVPAELNEILNSLCTPGENEIQRLGQADRALGLVFAEAVNKLLEQANLTAQEIKAIGSHGQTIRHMPKAKYPFTLQIADPNTIAANTGITTVADFRRKDIALNGQGAPLAPAFHEFFFRHFNQNRIVLNIGGIANITLLSHDPNQIVTGFDTGPGNTLLDQWIKRERQLDYDKDGQWAHLGTVQLELLYAMLSDPYFTQSPPKSTGREYFNIPWLMNYLQQFSLRFKSEDIQATLVELTAMSITQAINRHAFRTGEILICGGGWHNSFLIERIKQQLPDFNITSTSEYGIAPDWVEAMAFAWFAKQTLLHHPINLSSITGASRPAVLGGVYFA